MIEEINSLLCKQEREGATKVLVHTREIRKYERKKINKWDQNLIFTFNTTIPTEIVIASIIATFTIRIIVL